YLRWAARQDRLAPEDYKDLRICEDPDHPGVLLPEGECRGTPGWVTVNARAGYAPWDFLRFQLNLENLADARYKTHGSGILSPGVQATLSVTGTY
ncbi:MAG: TonB-dependent receptor, partial [Deltaproteobacteria bacterium]|nr:TonB-dependent receptor [Deltaproteobacteria bacterium]